MPDVPEPTVAAEAESSLSAGRQRAAERIRGLWRTEALTRIATAVDRGHSKAVTDAIDVFALVEAAVTFCIDHTFTDAGGADLDDLVEHVTDVARRMSETGAAELSRTVVEWLLGEDRGRQHRRARPANPAEGYQRQSIDVPLLRRQQSRIDSNALVVTADDALINMLYVAFNRDLADAAAAHDAVIRAQLSQGRFSAARETARQNAAITSAYAEQLTGQLDLTRRNVAAADWTHGIPALIERARTHIHDRKEDESDLIEIAENLAVEQAEKGEDANHADLAAIGEVIRSYRSVHLALYSQVIGATGVFLDAQAYQGFGVQVDPAIDFTDAFRQALIMPAGEVADAVDAARTLVQSPQSPSVVTVGAALTILLAAPREVTERIEAEAVELVDLPDRRLFTSEEIADVLRSFITLPSPTALSSLLDPADPKRADLTVMLALAEFGGATIDATVTPSGTTFRGDTHHGDDLTITPGDAG